MEHVMTRKISRREFIKAAGIGAAASAVLTGCGPDSRYVVREPYIRMPEYTYNGESTYYATSCRECPAGCGTVVRTEQGRALKIEGNPNHPINLGKLCSRGQAALQGLYNPDRIQDPVKQEVRTSQNFSSLTWDDAVSAVKNTLQNTPASQIAFLLGMAPDHLFDLVSELCTALGAPAPIRYGAHEIYDARLTLVTAVQQLFSTMAMPYFDLANADVTFSFGANFLETYLSPMEFSRGFSQMRRGNNLKRGYLVQFEPRLSQTAASADEWISAAPGSLGMVAQAIGRLVAEIRGGAIPNAYQDVDINTIAQISDISITSLQRLANMFASASHPLAIPGVSCSGLNNGLESTQAVLALNVLAGNLGKPGGVYLSPTSSVHPEIPWLPNSMQEVKALIDRMFRGEVKALFIHGLNPVFELPETLGFVNALGSVSQVFSFASFPDETSAQADYIMPDHTGLESWGYQKAMPGADREVISGSQPAVAPFYNTKATADVLLAAVQVIGGNLATTLGYKDEVDYLKTSLSKLVAQPGFYSAPEINTFMSYFQQYGGWWESDQNLNTPSGASALDQPLSVAANKFDGVGDTFLFPYMSPILGDGSGANKPWLQETPDPTTTVMWDNWVEINPDSAKVLGVTDDDIVKITSPAGAIEAVVYVYPAIRLDTVAIGFGQGHSAYGRYAEGRGVNPHQLLTLQLNSANDLAYGSMRVSIEKTGRRKALSRLESRMGVYGQE
jgi:anaerobic selenocysteine-containing dehydrogenase